MENNIMKSKIIAGIVVLVMASILIGLAVLLQNDKVKSFLTQEADNFDTVQRITVINCIDGDILFQTTGKMAINMADNQIEIIVEKLEADTID